MQVPTHHFKVSHNKVSDKFVQENQLLLAEYSYIIKGCSTTVRKMKNKTGFSLTSFVKTKNVSFHLKIINNQLNTNNSYERVCRMLTVWQVASGPVRLKLNVTQIIRFNSWKQKFV